MVTSMLEKAIEIEGLLRIIRDGNPLPETYILLNIKTAELAEQALCLEERAASSEAVAATADFQLDVPEEGAPTKPVEIAKIPDEPSKTVRQADETPAPAEEPAFMEPAFMGNETVAETSSGSTEEHAIKDNTQAAVEKADFVMTITEGRPTLPPVLFTEEAEPTAASTPEMMLEPKANADETYPDLDELELSEDDDIILNFEDNADTTLSETTSLTDTQGPIIIATPLSSPQVADSAETEYNDNEPETKGTEANENESEVQAYGLKEKVIDNQTATATKRTVKLKSAFSLNDRFLYSRELFDGNMKMFDSTLEFIEGIEDYSIIEDYFYSELEWDPEDRNVATFMEILRPHFRE